MRRLIVLLLLLCLPATAAWAMGRLFPANARLGELQAWSHPRATISGKEYLAGPGLRIFDRLNRIIPYGFLNQRAPVAFQLGPNGELVQLWLISAEEEAALKAAADKK